MIIRFFGRLFVAIDQLGNVLAGGNPDNTISARVGYFANFGKENYQWYWKIPEKIINTTFWPLDGKNHCLQAYFNDAGEKFDPGRCALIHFTLNTVVILSCIPLFLLFYLLYIIGLVHPKPNRKLVNLKKRLIATRRKLSGIESEFAQTHIIGDSESLALLDQIIKKAIKIKGLIEPQVIK
ncbi:hypothetical protein GTQ40_06770 [Flavobacteriaceae bacterium R38]|nr:hypothetical protein [Flavobacteriaceae bacterium R38]